MAVVIPQLVSLIFFKSCSFKMGPVALRTKFGLKWFDLNKILIIQIDDYSTWGLESSLAIRSTATDNTVEDDVPIDKAN